MILETRTRAGDIKMKNLQSTLLLVVFCLLASGAFAQDKSKQKHRKHEFCSKQTWSNGNRVSASDLRETKLSAGNTVKVDSQNGRITIKGENRNDVLVRACVRAWAKTSSDAESLVNAINIKTSPNIRAENMSDRNVSVSYEIHVPNSTNLNLKSNNGRITISDVAGQLKFETRNGRITLNNVAGDVKGETNNGRVTVKLSGSSWQGNGLNVRTNNGRISLYMPSNYSANVDAGTGNGRFRSDFAALSIKEKKRRYGANRVSASINGGGAPIRLETNNGRVSIRSNSN